MPNNQKEPQGALKGLFENMRRDERFIVRLGEWGFILFTLENEYPPFRGGSFVLESCDLWLNSFQATVAQDSTSFDIEGSLEGQTGEVRVQKCSAEESITPFTMPDPPYMASFRLDPFRWDVDQAWVVHQRNLALHQGKG